MPTRCLARLVLISSTILVAPVLGCGSDEADDGDSGPGASGNGGSGAEGGAGGTGATGGDTLCPPEPTASPPALKLTEVASGLDFPVLVLGAPGDESRLYVVEQPGRIQIIKDGAVLPEPFLDIDAIVQDRQFEGDERGLLGLAFHPDYAENGRFFVHYTDDEDNHGHMAEYRRSSDPDKAEPEAVKVILQIDEFQYGNHNGGMLAFGGDGLLYMGMGDGGDADDPDGNGQNIDVKLGKMLRMDPDTYPEGVSGNLPGGNPHVWDYGLRNPWRFSFDRCTHDLYIGDVGQGAWEEIDVEPAGEGHKNYGWDITEGSQCHEPSEGCPTEGITMPVAEYSHDEGCSVNGGFVYRGTQMPNLVGTYFYGAYCDNRIWTLVWKDGALVSGPTEISDSIGSDVLVAMSSFGEDTRGELYVVDLGGSIYRIEAQ